MHVDEDDRKAWLTKAWHNVWWLAAGELWRARVSYLATALFTVIVALFAFALSSGFYSGFDGTPGFFLDMYFLLICCNLALNWTAPGYWQPGEDLLSKRLRFLRTLPIALRELVASRAAVMVATLAVMAPIFFLTLYLLSGDLRADLGPARFLSFAAIWSGYALLMGALGLYLEWGFSGERLLALQFVWAASLVALALLAGVLGVGIFAGTVELARSHGPLPAVVALLIGLAGLALSGWATTKRLRHRDLSV